MNAVINLLRKELLVIRGSLWIWVLVIFCYGMIMFRLGMYLFLIVLFALAMLLGSFIVDHRNGGFKTICSLPAGRGHLVLSRYIWGLLTAVAVICVALAFAPIYQTVFTKNLTRLSVLFSVRTIALSLCLIILIEAFFLPFIFAFGWTKGFWMGSLFLFVLIIAVSLIENKLTGGEILKQEVLFSAMAGGVTDWLRSAGSFAVLGLTGGALLFYGVSLLISVVCFRRKDL